MNYSHPWVYGAKAPQLANAMRREWFQSLVDIPRDKFISVVVTTCPWWFCA